MMNKLMHWLAPKGVFGFFMRLTMFTGIVAAANLSFAWIFDDDPSHDPAYYIGHAVFVGTPLIAIFLAVSVFQIKLQRKLWRLSRKDGLTGLNNRSTFIELTEAARNANDNGVLLMLDADHFKKINDTYGHHAGDECLRAIAHNLRRNVRQGDVIGRIGGEEFAIYLKGITKLQAHGIGTRITERIPFRTISDEHLTVTLSIGAAVSCPNATLDQLFMSADSALYDAKANGRAQIVFAETDMTSQAA